MPPQIMALKWRPKVFADMVGQEQITRTLQNAIKANRLAHAYIFAGPRGVGKTTTARIFAKAINCRNPKDAEPCNSCDICDEVNNGSSFDIVEIDAAAVNGVDDIRELQQRVGNAPAKARFKVYIFDEAHRITKPAFDAFLKTLEEPPEHVIFILASTEIHAFPATVQSRCQRFEFRSMGLETLLKQLRHIADEEKIEIDDKSLYQIARSGGGSMRDAQRNLDQLVAFSGKKVTLEDIRVVLGTIAGEVYLKLVEAAIQQDPASAMMVVKSVIEGGKDLEHFHMGLLETFRHLAMAKAFPSSAATMIPLADDEVQKLIEYSSQMDEAQILSSLRLLIEQEWSLRHSANPQIIVETLILELCRMKQLTSVGDLLNQIEGRSLDSASSKALSPSSKVTGFPTPAPTFSKPSFPAIGEPVLAVDEIEDPVEAEKNPEMAKLKGQWTELLEKIGAQKKALQGVLVDTRPKNFDEGALILLCKGAFHQEQLSKPENKVLVEKLIEEILGRKINLVPVLPEVSSAPSPLKSSAMRAPKSHSAPKIDVENLEKEEPIVAAALKMFSGTIVEVKRNNTQK